MSTDRAADRAASVTAFALTATLLGGGSVIASKCLVTEMDPHSALFFRGLLAAVWLVLLGAMLRRAPLPPQRFGAWGAAAAMLTLGNLGLFYVGATRTDASRAVLILNLQPFLVAALARATDGERSLTPPKLLGMALAFAGVALLFHGERAATATVAGDVLIFGATVFWSLRVVAEKRAIDHAGAPGAAASLVVWESAALAGLYVVGMLVTDWRPVTETSYQGIYALMYIVLVGSSAVVLERWLFARAGVSRVSNFNFLIPVWGVLLSGVVLGEAWTRGLMASMLLVSAGVALTNVGWARVRPAPVLVPAEQEGASA